MEQRKFLDQKGVEYLWSQLSLEDYPNNQTLVAILNAIDDTKADKDYVDEKIPTTISQLENDVGFLTEHQDLSDYYTKEQANELHNDLNNYISTEITDLVNSAPETLDTLGELATAFQENEEIVEILNQAIATKYSADNPPPYPITSVQGLTGNVSLPYETWTFTLDDGSTITKKVVIV